MITEYHRPESLDDAVSLLSRPNAYPLGGGTMLSKPTQESIEVIDLQTLGLNKIHKKGNNLEIGATATLQQLLENSSAPTALKVALRLEAPFNLRNAATAAGTLVAADGRSPFTTILLALDAKLTLAGEPKTDSGQPSRVIALGEYLPLRPGSLQRKLIIGIEIPLSTKLAFETVARTPADKPLVCAALAHWASGRTRLALGGFGKVPLLAMDGTEASGLESTARNAYHEAEDEWASAEYRMQMAATLAVRCLQHVGNSALSP
jgi:CO/xanthine dehydrogenase FAD-binding subunit